MTELVYFGHLCGSFVPEQIQFLLDQLEETYEQYRNDTEFLSEYQAYLKDKAGRETPLNIAQTFT
ncbi:tryptophan synthase subunit beta, partial [Streptococcus suis]